MALAGTNSGHWYGADGAADFAYPKADAAGRRRFYRECSAVCLLSACITMSMQRCAVLPDIIRR